MVIDTDKWNMAYNKVMYQQATKQIQLNLIAVNRLQHDNIGIKFQTYLGTSDSRTIILKVELIIHKLNYSNKFCSSQALCITLWILLNFC